MGMILFGALSLVVGYAIHRLADVLPKSHQADWRIPYRLPLIAITNLLAFNLIIVRAGVTIQSVLALIYTAIFLLVLVIDYEHRLILNIVILPAILIAALASPITRPGLALSLLGGALAFIVVFVIYIAAPIYSRWRGHTLAVPFGFGDVKLALFVGIVTGFPAAIFALFLAIFLGGIAAILVLAYQYARTRRINTGAPIAYGPYFCIAGWVFMVFGLWWMG